MTQGTQSLCSVATQRDRVRREEGGGFMIVGTHVYLWLIHTDVCYAKSLQSCPTLCDPIDGSPPGSTVPGIFQARILEWVAISFSNA